MTSDAPLAGRQEPRPGRTPRGQRALAAAAGLACALLPGAAAAQQLCRQALVFALDVSGSVDETEYRQQLEGLAGALQDPDVQDAILLEGDEPLAVAAFEWSSATYRELIIDWTFLRSEGDVAEVAARLRRWNRKAAPRQTAIGAGLQAAAALLERGPQCWRTTVDISSDGRNNDGPAPNVVRTEPILRDATVNALVVGSSGRPPTPEELAELEALQDYLKENVVGGPGGFVTIAESYDDYLAAMRRKLLNEIGTAPIWLAPEAPDNRPG